MVHGVVQATLFSSGDSNKLKDKPVVNWTLPAWVHPINSSSWEMAFPRGEYKPTILHTRVAEALGIEAGDELEFEIEGERFKLPVSISDTVISDFTISWEAGIVTSSTILSSGPCSAQLSTGKEVCLIDQELFASAKAIGCKGRGILYFDGVSRNEPHIGPAGLGFCIYTMDENGRSGHVLLSGYRFLGMCTSNHADYQAFIEGMTWAMRFNFEKLWIRGDSQLIINQLSGKFRVKSSNLKKFYHKAHNMLDDTEAKGCSVTLQHIAHEKNNASEVLANFAIDLKSNAYACNWKYINLHLNPEKYAVSEEEERAERERISGIANGHLNGHSKESGTEAKETEKEKEEVTGTDEEKKENDDPDKDQATEETEEIPPTVLED